jgi:hypothetical protein
MKSQILRLIVGFMSIIVALSFTGGCGTQAPVVNANISRDADNFKVSRRIAVINTRTDTPLFEIVGKLSLSNNSKDELVVTVKVDEDSYKKHFIYLGPNVAYIVEDISGAEVSPYQYEVSYIPEHFIPFTIKRGS